MLKFIGFLVVLAVLFAAVGYFRGWFDVSSSDQAGSSKIELQIDKEKLRQDVDAVKNKAREWGRSNSDEQKPE